MSSIDLAFIEAGRLVRVETRDIDANGKAHLTLSDQVFVRLNPEGQPVVERSAREVRLAANERVVRVLNRKIVQDLPADGILMLLERCPRCFFAVPTTLTDSAQVDVDCGHCGAGLRLSRHGTIVDGPELTREPEPDRLDAAKADFASLSKK